MVDRRFHTPAGPFTADELSQLVKVGLAGASDSKRVFTNVAPLEIAGESDISFLDNPKYIESFRKSRAGACVVRPKFADDAPQGMLLLTTEEPYFAYAKIAAAFYPGKPFMKGISERAFVDPSAKLHSTVHIEDGAVIKAGAEIGEESKISSGTVIGESVLIGKNTFIGSNVTITNALIGDNVIIHPGVRIGQDGFGFAPSASGLIKVPQLGRVIVENDVEIGANTCIDRGSGPDTIIGAGTKIDNLVQIGHNVKIGRSCIIVSQVGISGSTIIGDGAVIGGQAGLAGHIRIGAGAKIAAQSGVMHEIPQGQSFGGYPAVPIKDWHRQTVALKKMIKKNSD